MPKKAKKGGGAKGGVKTEEERRLYLEQRAQAEEEMAKKKEEILTLFLKDKLQKEERNTAVNLLKLNEGWRSILRQTRDAELRNDVTVLSQTFERHLDALDNSIKNLERDVLETERQAARGRRVHLQHLEHLQAQQQRRLMFVQQQWESGLQHISSKFISERKQMLANSKQQRADLEDATFTVAHEHKAVMEEIHRLYSESTTAYKSAIDDIVPPHRTSSVTHTELQLENAELMERTIENQVAAQLCNEERKNLDKLLSENQEFILKTNRELENVKKLQETCKRLRESLKSNKKENWSVIQNLEDARNKAKQETHELQNQLTQARSVARKQLTVLTVQSNAAAKKLRAVISKGEKVLRIAELCHKLENKQKNILSTVLSKEPCLVPQTEEAAKEVPGEFPELRQVRWRIGTAVLQREALKKRRDDVSRENLQLRLLLQQHLDANTVSDSAFNGHHPLLTVCQAPTATAPPDTSRRHTVIEAAHAAKHML
ncbi:dynein regulatory complex subunit 2 [Symphorus nematophorus]